MSNIEKEKQIKVYSKKIVNNKEVFIWVVPENIYIGNITLKEYQSAVEGQFKALNQEIKQVKQEVKEVKSKIIDLLKTIGGIE
ncbi:MAG: hypothetical protein EOL97_14300 [Spirochaetia bacterium]|nr:hypothetical protein [Spirochaetia bacterium]